MSVYDSPAPSREERLLDELLETLDRVLESRPWSSFDELLERHSDIAARLAECPELRIDLKRRFDLLCRWSRFTSGLSKAAESNYPQIDGFEVRDLLGEGGMGIVYRARQPSLERDVALKLMQGGRFSSERARRRFLSEARIAANLHHPNIAPIYDFGQSNGLPYLVQELLPGGSLAQQLRGKAQPAFYCAQVIEVLAGAVDYAHQNGVVHRDLKPANVLLSESGQFKIIDFGLAKALDAESDLTRTGELPGTPSYMAPEQAVGGVVGPATDVYGLGAILYEMLTGRPPFTGASHVDTMRRVVDYDAREPRTLQKDVPRDLQAICLKCLEKEPARRYATAGELADDLRRFLNGEPVRARSPGPVERLLKWSRRRPAIAALIAISTAAVLSGIVGSTLYSMRVTNLLHTAQELRIKAEDNERTLRRHLYAADLGRAYTAYEQNNLAQMDEILARYQRQEEQEDLRGFPWYLLKALRHPERLNLQGHQGNVYTVIYSPDGKLLASCGQDCTVRLWDAASGQLLTTLRGHAKEVNHIAFSSAGRWLASAGEDRRVLLWDVANQRPGGQVASRRSEPNPPITVIESDEPIYSVDFSGDGRTLAAGGRDRKVRLVDVETQELISILPMGDKICSLRFARDRQTLFVATSNLVRKLHVKTGEELNRSPELLKGEQQFTTLALSHDGTELFGADTKGVVYQWMAETLQPEASLFASGRIDALAISPAGQQIVVGGIGRDIELRDISSTKLRRLQGHADRIWSAEFSPDGTEIASASADGTVKVWKPADFDPRRLVSGSEAIYRSLAFSPDSRTLALGDHQGEIGLWDVATGELRVRLRVDDADFAKLTFDPIVVSLGFSPDGRRLASSYVDGVIRVWDVESATVEHKLIGASRPGGVSFSPDGMRLAAGAMRTNIAQEWQVWDLDRRQPCGNELQLWDGCWVKYLPDAQILAAFGNAVSLFQANQFSQESSWEVPDKKRSCFDISADGALVVTGGDHLDRCIHLWDMRSGNLEATLVGHEADVVAVALAPDRRTIASASSDGTLRLWDIAARQEVLRFDCGVVLSCEACQFSPDGQALAIAATEPDGNSVVTIWSARQQLSKKPIKPSRWRTKPPESIPNRRSRQPGSAMRVSTRDVGSFNLMYRERISKCHGWALSHGYAAAIPTFNQRANHGVIERCAVVIHEASGAELWSGVYPPLNAADFNIQDSLRTANQRPDLPNHAEAALVIGDQWSAVPKAWDLVLFHDPAIERRDIPIDQVGETNDLFERFRRIHRWAKAHGYPGGFPTFIDGDQGGKPTYGVALIKPGKGSEVWIPITEF